MPAARRRALIVERAAEVFAERGYDGASVDEIVRRSDISAPVLYDHFPSKLALFREVLDTEYARLRGTWSGLGDGGPARERFTAALDAWFAHVEERRGSIPVLFHGSAADEDARRAQRDATRASRSALVPLVAGVLVEAEPDQVEMLVEVIAGSLASLALWWHDHPAVPRARLVAAAFDALWSGVGARVRP
ncbi:TetR family transcriptional regulator [Umezawaea tangerina]|uniref:TetR family transcriptional regulator n=2 Tax=Umezawaea tangerina TaxID=84725 RepID=A0A2T0SQN6_9PSEU|nr:TetR family transcriptional regulator [Umezawaea tangerina]